MVDKARLDFACVLISTSFLEVVNKTSEIFIDGCKHSIHLVEEWCCNLGEDSFLSKKEIESRTRALSEHNDAPGMEEVQWELDDLVNDLNKEWSQQEEQPEEKEIGEHVVILDEHGNKAVAEGTTDQMGKQSTVAELLRLQQHVMPASL